MKTFRWDWVKLVGSSQSFMWLSERDGDIGKVWGAVIKQDEYYRVVVINKARTEKLSVDEPILLMKDAKESILKKLFDDGIIEDQDILEDYTE